MYAIMKIKIRQVCLLPLLMITACALPCIGQQKNLNIQITGSDGHLLYASNEIRKAATENKYKVTGSSFLTSQAGEEMVVRVVSDSAASVKVANDQGFKIP